MSSPDTITQLIKRQHTEIYRVLNELINNREQNNVFSRCKHLTNLMTKHFFIEEHAILNEIRQGQEELHDLIFQIMKQHDQIKDDLKLLLDYDGDIDVTCLNKIKEDLDEHSNFEIKALYTKIDELISEEQRAKLIEKIKAYEF